MSECKVAPGSNTRVLSPLRFAHARFDSLPEHQVGGKAPTSGEKDESWFERFVKGLHIDPLVNAYVLVIPLTDGCSTHEPMIQDLMLCRTNKSGMLLEITEGEIDQNPPDQVDAVHRRWFGDDEEFLYFWTLSKDAFRFCLDKCHEDLQQALKDFEFTNFQMVETYGYWGKLRATMEKKDCPFSLLDANQPRSWRYAFIREYLFNVYQSPYSGYYPNHIISQMSKSIAYSNKGNERWVLAGSTAINALYMAELAYYHALSLPQKHSEELAVFAQAADAIGREPDDEPDPALVEAMDYIEGTGGRKYRSAHGEEYKAYARACAERRVPGDLFKRAVRVLANRDDWREAAADIQNKYGVPHPSGRPGSFKPIPSDAAYEYFSFFRFRPYWDYAYKCAQASTPRPDFMEAIEVDDEDWKKAARKIPVAHPLNQNEIDPDPPPRDLLMRYFDIYAFGAWCKLKGWWDAYHDTQTDVEAQTARVCAAAGQFLEKHADASKFLLHMELHYSTDVEKRAELNHRYLDACLYCGTNWTEELKFDQPDWYDKWQPVLAWLSGSTDKGGETISLLFEAHLSRVENMQKLFLLLGEDKKKVERALDKLVKMGKRVGAASAPRKVQGTTLTFQAGAEGRLIIKGVGPASIEIEVEVLTEQVEKTVTTGPPLPSKKKRKAFNRAKRQQVTQTVQVMEHRIKEVPLPNEKNFPKYMSAFGDGLSLAMSSSELIAEFKKKDPQIAEVLIPVVKDVCQFIDSGSDMLAAVSKRVGEKIGASSALKGVIGAAKVAGAGLEAYLNLKEGSRLLIIPVVNPNLSMTSATAKAVASGDSFAGWMQTMKGIALVGVTAAGLALGAKAAVAAYLAGAAAAGVIGAAMPPLIVALIIVTAIVIAIDVILYFHSGPGDVMDSLKDDLADANEEEYGHDFGEQMAPSKRRTSDEVRAYADRIVPVLAA